MKFKEFKIKDIFNVTGSKCIFHANNTPVIDKWEDGYRRYIVRSEYKNGLKGYIKEDFDYLNPPHTISFAQDTFIAFTQTKSYFTGNNVKILHPLKEDINTHHLLYLETAINKTVKEYSWGMGSTKKEINNYKIFLPTSDGVNPDWDYMENYIENMQNKYKEQLKKKNDQWIKDACKITGINPDEILKSSEGLERIKLSELEYDTGELLFQDLFSEINRGDIVNQGLLEKSEEGIVFVTQSDSHNGYTDKVKRSSYQMFNKNSITIGRQTGIVYYQPYEFVTTDGVLVVETKNKEDWNKSNLLYLVTALKKALIDYGYNNTVSAEKLKNLKLILPIDKEGNPDFSMMEKIMHTHTLKSLLKINKYLMKES